MKAAREFMDSCKVEDKPFCMFIASNDSHGPYTTGDRSVYDADAFTIPPYWLDTPKLREELVKYYAEISNFDKLVGQMREELEARGLWESTIFMVCSEQGTSFPFAKWTCYDNGLHTGLVAHWPGVIEPGSVAEELVSMADIAPTFVEAAGGTVQKNDFDGKSILKMLQGEKQVNHSYVFGAFTNCNIIGSRDRVYPIRVIRDKSFTLIYNPNHDTITSNAAVDRALAMVYDLPVKGEDVSTSWVKISERDPSAKGLVHKLHHRPEYEFYDHKNDPFELKNEINNPEYKEVIEELKKHLHAKLEELGDQDPIATEKSLINIK
jgi:uncharacterized sulfatase